MKKCDIKVCAEILRITPDNDIERVFVPVMSTDICDYPFDDNLVAINFVVVREVLIDGNIKTDIVYKEATCYFFGAPLTLRQLKVNNIDGQYDEEIRDILINGAKGIVHHRKGFNLFMYEDDVVINPNYLIAKQNVKRK